jgi:hypothetical protein
MARLSPMLALSLFLVACGGCGGSGPATPPVPSPPAVPAATAPTPAPTLVVLGCGVGPSTGAGNCIRTSPTFLAEVDAAIDRVVAKQPGLFNLGDQRGTGGYLVKDSDVYYRLVVEELEMAGFCATADGGEVALKITNSFNDQYHIMISSGHIRRGEASYRASCYPSWF